MTASLFGDDELLPDEPVSEVDQLVRAVMGSLAAKNRERINESAVRTVIAGLDLSDAATTRHVPRLRIDYLRFVGDKWLRDDPVVHPIDFERSFEDGVNLIIAPKNGAGKSSILKTIRFALTGDADHIDGDVLKWLQEIWLCFSLDHQQFTVMLSRHEGDFRGALVEGKVTESFDAARQGEGIRFEGRTLSAVRTGMQDFFFYQFGLSALSWLQDSPASDGDPALRSTSWVTYFQGLSIRDDSDQYLVCDKEHNIGNQQGLILSSLLGLKFVQPLNDLQIEQSRVIKETKQDHEMLRQQAEAARQEHDSLTKELATARARIRSVEQEQRTRQRAVQEEMPDQALMQVRLDIDELQATISAYKQAREEANQHLQRLRTRRRRATERLAIKLHLTGLEVTVCPNCDGEISAEAVAYEQTHHQCRVCHRPASPASPDEIALVEAEIAGIDQQIQEETEHRDRLAELQKAASQSLVQLQSQIEPLRQATRRGIEYALETDEERQAISSFNQEIGRLSTLISGVAGRMNVRIPKEEALDVKAFVFRKVREKLAAEAERRNSEILARLSTLTQEMVRLIGAESVSDIHITALGAVLLRKNGVAVPFGKIKNPGDRLRIKLAFFLAMMQLGREPGLGRHPGVLLIDSPGSAEMEPAAINALAGVLRHLDSELGLQMQVIGATREEAFREATAVHKVCGPTAGRYMF